MPATSPVRPSALTAESFGVYCAQKGKQGYRELSEGISEQTIEKLQEQGVFAGPTGSGKPTTKPR